MSYWRWWIKRGRVDKIFIIYWFLCIVIGFYNISILPFDSNFFVFSMLSFVFVIHPGIILLIVLSVQLIFESYKKYKKELK